MFDDKWYSKEEKYKAHHIVAEIERKWHIKPDKCVLCWWWWKIEAHHFDYSKKYQVVYICRRCHRRIHHSNDNIIIKKEDITDLRWYSNKNTKKRSKYIWRNGINITTRLKK